MASHQVIQGISRFVWFNQLGLRRSTPPQWGEASWNEGWGLLISRVAMCLPPLWESLCTSASTHESFSTQIMCLKKKLSACILIPHLLPESVIQSELRVFTFLITVLHILLFKFCPGSSEARMEFPVTSVISDLFISTPEAADLKVEILRERASEMHYFLVCIISNRKKTEKGGKAEGKILWDAWFYVTNSLTQSKNSLEKLEVPPAHQINVSIISSVLGANTHLQLKNASASYQGITGPDSELTKHYLIHKQLH